MELIQWIYLIICGMLFGIDYSTVMANNGKLRIDKDVERILKQWAPVVWLAPEEKFMPIGVDEFLNNVHAVNQAGNIGDKKRGMPIGDDSKKSFLVTNVDVEDLLNNKNSFIYGKNPKQHPVPVYAVVSLCDRKYELSSQASNTINPITDSVIRGRYIPVSLNDSDTVRTSSRLFSQLTKQKRSEIAPMSGVAQPTDDLVTNRNSSENEVSEFITNLAHNVKFTDSGFGNIIDFKKDISSFHVTYWMFYPYSQGKQMCTLDLGLLGNIPFPAMFGFCLGERRDIGSHVGDWEHMTLFFNGNSTPESMYVSAHDAGAYYNYNHLTGSFEFQRQETRKGILQRPIFPKTVTTSLNHPVLFAAKGSHGLWTAPGKHRFVKVARLYDINGFGTPWHTWKALEISYEQLKSARTLTPNWLLFKGKWGNPKNKCHPLRRIGLNFCEYSDGPTGIPLKEPHFHCIDS